MARTFLVSRIALAVALSSGLSLAVAPPALAAKKEKAPAVNFSDAFRKAAGPIQEAISGAASKLPANAGPTDLAAAKSQIDAALGGDGKAALEATLPAATTPDDKNALGSFMRNYGIIAQDAAFKQRGTLLMIESGKAGASIGSLNYDAGVTAYQAKDYAGAATYLKAAKDAGYQDPNGQLDMVLVDAYKRSGNSAAALQMAKDEIAAAQAQGKAPAETTLRTALQETYSAKQLAPSLEYAALLGQYYPQAWDVAISVVGQLAGLPRDQDVDLMRLKYLTNAMSEKRDYFLFLEDVDPRAYPGEALKVLESGIAKGKLTAAEVTTEKAEISARVGADRASLPSTAASAMNPGASVGVVTGAGDLFLSYDDPAKAETFYAKALGMPGADANKVALRLGMAQVMQGKHAEAQANFAKVTGTRAAVAKMWDAYAKSKAPASAPAAPSAAPTAPAAAD